MSRLNVEIPLFKMLPAKKACQYLFYLLTTRLECNDVAKMRSIQFVLERKEGGIE